MFSVCLVDVVAGCESREREKLLSAVELGWVEESRVERERCESERARQGTPVFLFVCLLCLHAVGRERERERQVKV